MKISWKIFTCDAGVGSRNVVRNETYAISGCERLMIAISYLFFFSSRRRHTRFDCDWSSDVCSSDLSCFHHQGHRSACPLRVGPIDERRRLAIDSARTDVFHHAGDGDQRSRDVALPERAAHNGRRRFPRPETVCERLADQPHGSWLLIGKETSGAQRTPAGGKVTCSHTSNHRYGPREYQALEVCVRGVENRAAGAG